MANGQTGNPYAGGQQAPMRVYWTAKTINATAGSRSAINDNIQVNDVVVMDPYGQDETLPDGSVGPICVTQPQTSFLRGRKYVVTAVPDAVNDIPDTVNASTQRRGGFISVVPLDLVERIQAHVDGTTDIAVNDILEVTNGSWKLTKAGTLTDIYGTACAVAQEAFTTNGEGTIRVGALFGA